MVPIDWYASNPLEDLYILIELMTTRYGKRTIRPGAVEDLALDSLGQYTI